MYNVKNFPFLAYALKMDKTSAAYGICLPSSGQLETLPEKVFTTTYHINNYYIFLYLIEERPYIFFW